MSGTHRAEGAKTCYSDCLRIVRKNRGAGSFVGALAASMVASSIATGPACSSDSSPSRPASRGTSGTGGATSRPVDGGVLPDGAAADAGGPFEPISAAVYVAKVKNILVGLPPTDDEVRR